MIGKLDVEFVNLLCGLELLFRKNKVTHGIIGRSKDDSLKPKQPLNPFDACAAKRRP